MANHFPFKSTYSIEGVLLGPFASVGLMLFLLGFYVLLFGMVVYFLFTRRNMVNRKLHLGWVIVLFVLSVSSALIGAGITLREAALGFRAASTHDIKPLEDWKIPPSVPHLVLQVLVGIFRLLANCIADAILLYRWFVVWEPMKSGFIFLVLALLATNGKFASCILFLCLETSTSIAFGLVGYIISYAALGMGRLELFSRANNALAGFGIANAINTLILTLMIASRIWWRTRNARKFLGQETERTYKRIILVIIESGFVYSLSIIANVSVMQSSSSLGFDLDLTGVVVLMVGIAPTLVTLRTSLGLTESAVPDIQIISTLRFGESPATTSINDSQNLEVHSVDLEQGSTDASENLEPPKIERSDASSV
ncbi:hypothetical protein WG66_006502 [Moniliophthora roreri]|uniref:Uncharacterized protein n=1 Tax=Moniliophthora roreri TaxID=221103 RepID=A0A0W0FWZ2_MONRR|nr:hypothetical protein WG66_006502 [Moniliophthora roreri]